MGSDYGDSFYDYELDREYSECLRCNGGGPEDNCICTSCDICKGLINDWKVCYAFISKSEDLFILHRPGVVVVMEYCCRAYFHGMCLVEAVQAQKKPHKDDLNCPSCGDQATIRWLKFVLSNREEEIREFQKLSAEEKAKFQNDTTYQIVTKKEKKGKSNREKRDGNKQDKKNDKKDENEEVRTDEPEPGKNWATQIETPNGRIMKRHPLKRRNKHSFRRFEADDEEW